jgi:RHS repeat-associated protein
MTAGPMARTTTHVIDYSKNRLTDLIGSWFSLHYGYDAQGNVTTRDTQSFVFDQGNRMISVTGKADYYYDGFGHRFLTVLQDGTNQLSIYSPAGKLYFWSQYGSSRGSFNSKYAYLGNRLVGEVSSANGPLQTHTDLLGSPIIQSNAYGQGIDARTGYEPYGRVVAGSNVEGGRVSRMGYTGHWNDADNRLVYMQQRYYDPLAGRFLSIDPVTTDANTGDSFNRYAYVHNNPYTRIDPDGRRDIYIGGASDKDSTRIVQDYAGVQRQANPGRDIQYFSYSQKSEITAAIAAPLAEGEPLNVIGHSLGGREAIKQAINSGANITNLVTIDPVGSAGDGNKPASVGTWTDVTAVATNRNFSDSVASVGRSLLGTTATSGADSSQKVATSHGNFSTMMSKGSQEKVDGSYVKPKEPL